MKLTEVQPTLDRANALEEEMKEVHGKIHEYYMPIINELEADKDVKGLKQMLDIMPNCMTKHAIYFAIRNIEK